MLNRKQIFDPCGAVGISNVEVVLPKLTFNRFAKLDEEILVVSSRTINERDEDTQLNFETGLMNRGFGPSTVSLSSRQDEVDRVWLRDRGTGIRGLVLPVAGHKGHDEKALGAEGVSSTILLKW